MAGGGPLVDTTRAAVTYFQPAVKYSRIKRRERGGWMATSDTTRDGGGGEGEGTLRAVDHRLGGSTKARRRNRGMFLTNFGFVKRRSYICEMEELRKGKATLAPRDY